MSQQIDVITDNITKTDSILSIIVVIFLDSFSIGVLIPILPYWAYSMSNSGLMFGMLLASYAFMLFVFSLVWGRISDRTGRRFVILIGLIGTMSSYVTLIFTVIFYNTLEMLFLSRILAGIFIAATYPTAQAFISDNTNEKDRAKNFGFYGAAIGLGFTIGPVVGGILSAIEILIIPSDYSYLTPVLLVLVLEVITLLIGFYIVPKDHVNEIRNDSIDLKEVIISPNSKNSIKPLSLSPLTFKAVTFAPSKLDGVSGI